MNGVVVQGQQGDEVLVSGINTGTAKVCVKLAEKTWKVHMYMYRTFFT